MNEALTVLGISLVIVLLLVLAIVGVCVYDELKQQHSAARERARAEARLHLYTSAVMQRMYEAARREQAGD